MIAKKIVGCYYSVRSTAVCHLPCAAWGRARSSQ